MATRPTRDLRVVLVCGVIAVCTSGLAAEGCESRGDPALPTDSGADQTSSGSSSSSSSSSSGSSSSGGTDDGGGVEEAGDDADAASGDDAAGDATGDAAPEATAEGGDAALEAGPCNTMWPDGGTNLVSNPDFEDGGTGWSPLFGGTFATSTTAYCGSQSGELSGRTAFYNALATNIPTTAGTYDVAAWVRQGGPGTQPMALGGVCSQADGGMNFPGGPQAMVPANTWTFLSGTLVVPDGCSTMQFFVGQQTSAVTPFPDLFADEVYVGQLVSGDE